MILDNKKPEYGQKVIKNLSKRLIDKYSRFYYNIGNIAIAFLFMG